MSPHASTRALGTLGTPLSKLVAASLLTLPDTCAALRPVDALLRMGTPLNKTSRHRKFRNSELPRLDKWLDPATFTSVKLF